MRTHMKHLTSLMLCLALVACGKSEQAPAAEAGGHEAAAPEVVKGPHRGRLLSEGPFTIELAIFETGVPPEFRAWATFDGKALASSDFTLTVETLRLGDFRQTFVFKPEGQAPDDFLRAQASVHEPHSFDVTVTAEHAGKRYQWQYQSYEGRTRIAANMADSAGIKVETAGAAMLTETLSLYGQIVQNPERSREVSARFPGVIRSVAKALGEPVKAGETLALIESNESLRNYAVTAPISGVVMLRDANPGEQSGDRVLFTIVDPASVLAELSVFPKDRAKLVPGAAVTIRLADGDAMAEGTVTRVDVQAGSNQAVKARVALKSTDSRFVAGSFVTGEVVVGSREVPLAVKTSGLQPFRDFTVVYAQIGDSYEVRMLELGDQRGDMVEVLGGLEPGTKYVTESSYLIKADIEKSAASHDH